MKEFSCNDTQGIIDKKVEERQKVFDELIESREKVIGAYELIATQKLLAKKEKGMMPITDEKWIQKQLSE